MNATQRLEHWLNQPLTRKDTANRPRVTLAYAQSLDGSLTTERGRSLQLSGPKSIYLTHLLRASHDGILVGIGTVLADDPRLTARGVEGPQPQPVVLDSQLRIPLQSHLFDHPKPAWIAGLSDAPLEKKTMLEAAKAQVLEFPPDHNGQVPLKDLLQELWRRGIKRLMVEGGAQVITQFLAGDFVDEVVITMAPVWIGGLPVLGNRLQRRLCDVTVERAGEDIIVWGRPE